MTQLTTLPQWHALQAHYQAVQKQPLSAFFDTEPHRFDHFSSQMGELLVDYSKHYVTKETIELLIALAQARNLPDAITALFSGDTINRTENRAALHTALRQLDNTPIYIDQYDIMPEVQRQRTKMERFVDGVHKKTICGFSGKPFTDVVNIGIGGSDLGPKMAAQALQPYCRPDLRLHFVSHVDGDHLAELLPQLKPETTLFIITSKTFTTVETLANAKTAQAWFLDQTRDHRAFQQHFIGVSANEENMTAFGIVPDNQYLIWDWVGGRYSLWSTVGLPLALGLGTAQFKQFLQGGFEVDCHFRSQPFESNLPVLLGLLDVWYINFFQTKSLAIMPYAYGLRELPSYLQQLFMESCGKHVTNQGEFVEYDTGTVIWGAAGTNAQHAFFQLLHQGTQWLPVEFIVPCRSFHNLHHHQDLALANALAQAQALMEGQRAPDKEPFRHYAGSRPSTMVLFPRLRPEILGQLIALYEHRVFVQSVIWDINPFDQWGVELGKKISKRLLPALQKGTTLNELDLDDSTRQLIQYAGSTAKQGVSS